MSNTILVTGASGNIGRPLVQQLKAADAKVIAGSSSGKSVDGVPSRHVDFGDVASLKAAFAGVDTLFLLLPLVPNKMALAKNAIAAAKAAGVKHIVRSSGAGADATAGFALPKLHGEIDQLVIDSGIAYTLVRPATFMQNFATYYVGMIQGGALYLPQGQGRISFIDVRDIAAVNAAILQNPAAHAGKAYTLTGAVALSNAEVVKAIGDATGKTVTYVAVPDDAAIASMKGMGMDDWSIGQMMSLHQLTAAGYAAGTTDTVRQLIGRKPIEFAQFAADHRSAWV
ncbi:MAG: SDR family oxidoreductase [Rhodocyclaceae bacterium]|nr:SDR family oxidoreductase [Rhodocyclaceae bacterium]MCE2724566.1 SDR family oxidoreductase [Betaproteobacteria bacterium]MCA3019268.1 SDR family oxidoreductase [Rhodocyclaceae bacterium]MCA3022115.1 SDR family oxidoreductase [Rhodocyclaceae bacterium]MCA3024264.1 SDR family oxidoreductase [Rhodocyclaceae bacterium]